VIWLADWELAEYKELTYVATLRAHNHPFIVGNIEDTLLSAALDNISLSFFTFLSDMSKIRI
jgi:hypothetical protein